MRAREVGHDRPPPRPATNPIERSISPRSRTNTSPMASRLKTARLDEQVDEVAGGEELRVERLEEDRDEEQPADDGQDAALARRGSWQPTRGSTRRPSRRRARPGPRARASAGRGFGLRFGLLLTRCGSSTCAISSLASAVAARAGPTRPVVMRSTTICRSSSAAGRWATTGRGSRTAMRSATSKTSFMLCETISTARPWSASRRMRSSTIPSARRRAPRSARP